MLTNLAIYLHYFSRRPILHTFYKQYKIYYHTNKNNTVTIISTYNQFKTLSNPSTHILATYPNLQTFFLTL